MVNLFKLLCPQSHSTDSFPFNQDWLLAFIVHARDSLILPPATFKTYISGIQLNYRLKSVPSPILLSIPVIRLTLRGMSENCQPCSNLPNGCFTPSEDMLMEALCLAAFLDSKMCGIHHSIKTQLPGNRPPDQRHQPSSRFPFHHLPSDFKVRPTTPMTLNPTCQNQLTNLSHTSVEISHVKRISFQQILSSSTFLLYCNQALVHRTSGLAHLQSWCFFPIQHSALF